MEQRVGVGPAKGPEGGDEWVSMAGGKETGVREGCYYTPVGAAHNHTFFSFVRRLQGFEIRA